MPECRHETHSPLSGLRSEKYKSGGRQETHCQETQQEQVTMFGLQDAVPSLAQVRGPVTALKEEPLGANHGLSARSWMQPGIVDTSG